MKESDVIEPEEERRQACFHVMVLNRYPVPANAVALKSASAMEVTGEPVPPRLPAPQSTSLQFDFDRQQ
jgi:hypothetical protein